MKDTPPPDFETWDAFWEAEKKLVSERGPAPYGNGCGRWWCCGTWWAIENVFKKGGEDLKVRLKPEADFGLFLAGFMARRPEWFRGAAPQVLEARKPDPVRQAVVQAAPADFKSAAAGEDAEVVEDGYQGIE